jgi:iron complex outermembrane receptor protein
VPVGSEATASYTLWHAGLNYRQKTGTGTVNWFARLDNLSNALAYSATSILTSTVPGRAPLPGRSLKLGMQWQF